MARWLFWVANAQRYFDQDLVESCFVPTFDSLAAWQELVSMAAAFERTAVVIFVLALPSATDSCLELSYLVEQTFTHLVQRPNFVEQDLGVRQAAC